MKYVPTLRQNNDILLRIINFDTDKNLQLGFAERCTVTGLLIK